MWNCSRNVFLPSNSRQCYVVFTWFGIRENSKGIFMLNYKCRSHHESSLNSSLPKEQTSFFGFRSWNVGARKGKQSGAEGGCPTAAPTAPPQDPTRSPREGHTSSPREGPPSEGEATAQSTVTTPRSSSSPQTQLGWDQACSTLSPGLAFAPRPVPSRAEPRRAEPSRDPTAPRGSATANPHAGS